MRKDVDRAVGCVIDELDENWSMVDAEDDWLLQELGRHLELRDNRFLEEIHTDRVREKRPTWNTAGLKRALVAEVYQGFNMTRSVRQSPLPPA
jgi:hypothetical protein